MSTSEEFQEIPPDPVSMVTEFGNILDELLAASERLRQEPSEDRIGEFYAQAWTLKLAARPILEERFFHGSESELLISIGVGAIINSGNNLVEETQAIVGDDQPLSKFNEDIGEIVSESFIKNDLSNFGTVETSGDKELSDEEVFEIMARSVVGQVDGHFSKIVDQYVDVVMNDPSVGSYILARRLEEEILAESQAIIAERIRNAKLFAGVVSAAIVVSYLANKLSRR